MPDLREWLFTNRSYTPIPFVLVMIAFAAPTPASYTAGLILVALGEGMRFWGVSYAGPLTRVTGSVGAPELIVAGPFAYVRNPLYVGNILMYVGVGIMSMALVPYLQILALGYFVFQYSMIVSREEEFLREHFGEKYEEYYRSVPRFIPSLKKYVHESQTRQMPDRRAALRSERRTFQAIAITIVILTVILILQ